MGRPTNSLIPEHGRGFKQKGFINRWELLALPTGCCLAAPLKHEAPRNFEGILLNEIQLHNYFITTPILPKFLRGNDNVMCWCSFCWIPQGFGTFVVLAHRKPQQQLWDNSDLCQVNCWRKFTLLHAEGTGLGRASGFGHHHWSCLLMGLSCPFPCTVSPFSPHSAHPHLVQLSLCFPATPYILSAYQSASAREVMAPSSLGSGSGWFMTAIKQPLLAQY